MRGNVNSNEIPIMDKLVFLLRDHEELSINAISERLHIEEVDLKRVLKFLTDFGIVELLNDKKVRLTKLFKEFLKSL